MLRIRATKRDIAAVDALLLRAYPRLLKGGGYPPSTLVRELPLIGRAQHALVACGTYYVVEEESVVLGAGGWTVAPPG